MSTGTSKDSPEAEVSFEKKKRQQSLLLKNYVFTPAKSLALRMGRVFLALVRTLPLKVIDCSPKIALQFWFLNVL